MSERSQEESQDEQREQHQPGGRPPWMENRMGMGMTGGAQPTDFDNVPPGVENEADYWRGQAVQLEKALQDVGSLHSQQSKNQAFWNQAGRDDGMNLEQLLKHLWKRGIELGGVFAAVVFMIQLFGTGLPPLAQTSGVVAVTAFFDRYIRPIISNYI